MIGFRGPKIGERHGRYRIDSAWTSGPLGPTARARMLASDRPATLVWLTGVGADHVEPGHDDVAPAMRALRADELVPILDAWREPDGLVVASEEPRGSSLRARGASVTDVTDALSLVRGAALALGAAHRQGVAHGALTPELVWLEGTRARIAGLGLTRMITPAGLLRVAGHGVGRYLAPEQTREARATPATDVRALGVMLHELLAGRAPFDGATTAALLASIAEGAPAPLPPSVPADVRAIVATALATDPAARFADARALVVAIDAAIGRSAEVAVPAPRRAPGDDEVVWGAAALAEEPAGKRSTSAARGRSATPGRAPRFTGALAVQQLAYARSRYGAAIDRALAAIAAPDRDEVAGATALSWVRVEAFERFHDALARELGRPVEETHAELVAGGSRRTFNTLWRMLLRVGGTRLVVTRAPVVYSKTYDTGTMESQDVRDDGGRFVLAEWPDVPEFVLRGLRAGMTVALENVGRTGVVLTSTRTADGAVFTARWSG